MGPVPSSDALEVARDVAARVHGRKAPIRNAFVERFDKESDALAPLARLLRGTGGKAGQGGATRLKLLLSLIWLAGAGQSHHDAWYPASSWARLLDLPQPEGNGARRVSAALDWLERQRFVDLDRRTGQASRVVLLDERGRDEPYVAPFLELEAIPREERTRADFYFQLPPEFWTKGWLAMLRAPGIAMLLALITEAGGKAKASDLWFSPKTLMAYSVRPRS